MKKLALIFFCLELSGCWLFKGSNPPKTSYFLIDDFTHKKAYLKDNSGKILHSWRLDNFGKAWDDLELLPNKQLRVVDKNFAFYTLDEKSNILSKAEGRYHHDYDENDKYFLFLLSEVTQVPEIIPNRDIKVDYIELWEKAGLPKDHEVYGKLVFKWHVKDNIKQLMQVNPKALGWMEKQMDRDVIDFGHGNSVQLLPESKNGDDIRFKKNNILINFFNTHSTIIISPESGKVLWSMNSKFYNGRHTVNLLKNGNLLFFDNNVGTDKSRIIEWDPVNNRAVFEYGNKFLQDFFSSGRGSVYPTQDDNYLMYVSFEGRLLEIDREGKVLWEYNHPQISNYRKHKKFRKKLEKQLANGMTLAEAIRNDQYLGDVVGHRVKPVPREVAEKFVKVSN